MNPTSIARIIESEKLTQLSQIAGTLPRGRKNLNVHKDLNAPVQRLFNAMEPSTYVRPHRHSRQNGWELMLRVRGTFSIILFNDEGKVIERITLNGLGGPIAAEVPADTWHSVVSLETCTVMFEVKEGPYCPVEDKDFASWAPLENTPEAAHLAQWLVNAIPGETWSEN